MANFSDIKKEDCKLKAIPQGVPLGVSNTVILQSVINEIKRHGRSSMNKEVCGVLIGNLYWDQKPYLIIDARIEGKFADHQAGSVTFTSETWDYIHAELSEKYPDSKIVGWYHTHPGFGIFMSNMDFFIHENFFGIKWQPAYVFDPQSETDGFFFWNENNLNRGEITIIEDEKPEGKYIHPRRKVSVALTEEEEERQKKHVLTFSLVLLAFAFIIIASGLTIFILYQHNKSLEHKLDEQKERESEAIRKDEIQRRMQDEWQIKPRRKRKEAENRRLEAPKKKMNGPRVLFIEVEVPTHGVFNPPLEDWKFCLWPWDCF